MSLNRLWQSLAWRLIPHAGMEVRTRSGLRLPVRDQGAWGCLQEIILDGAYEPFWPPLREVRGWVDLGCNVGFFSLSLLDMLQREAAQPIETRAFLGDANEHCVRLTREAARLNGLADRWTCEHVVVGPPGQMVRFAQFKFSVHSGLFSRQKGERVFEYRATDLDALFARLQGVFDLIKFDIEGAEIFLIRHHQDLLRRFRFGLFEWHAPQLDGQAARTWLEQAGLPILAMRSQWAEGWDRSQGHSWQSPIGMAFWENPAWRKEG